MRIARASSLSAHRQLGTDSPRRKPSRNSFENDANRGVPYADICNDALVIFDNSTDKQANA
jgi:hypothetical protein